MRIHQSENKSFVWSLHVLPVLLWSPSTLASSHHPETCMGDLNGHSFECVHEQVSSLLLTLQKSVNLSRECPIFCNWDKLQSLCNLQVDKQKLNNLWIKILVCVRQFHSSIFLTSCPAKGYRSLYSS